MAYPALPCHLSGRSFPPSVRRYLGRRSPIPFPTIICFIKVEPNFVRVRLSGTGFPTSRYASPICTRILPDLTPQVVALTLSNRFRVVVRAAEKCTCGKSLTFAHKGPHSQRFCDVADTVKFYLKCDVAKSFRMGPLLCTMAGRQ